MMVKETKEFNHNLMIVGIVGVVAIIGILITLSTGTYTGKAYVGNTQEIAMFSLYENCKQMYGSESDCANNQEFMQSVKDWCSCRVYDRILDTEPTEDTAITHSEFEGSVMKGQCGERPACNQKLFGGDVTGKATGAGMESQKISNVNDFAECLDKFGNVNFVDRFAKDPYSADYTNVPAELVSWCGCRFADVIKNFHDGDARAIVYDSENFYGEISNAPLKDECGPNPITGE